MRIVPSCTCRTPALRILARQAVSSTSVGGSWVNSNFDAAIFTQFARGRRRGWVRFRVHLAAPGAPTLVAAGNTHHSPLGDTVLAHPPADQAFGACKRYPFFRPAGPQNGPKKGSCANLRVRSIILMFIPPGYSVKDPKTHVAELSTLPRFLAPSQPRANRQF